MKNKIIVAGLLLVTTANMQAQEFEPQQAVQFSTPQLNGSARYKSMGGAFGAIGGDVSSIQINPAGSAISLYHLTSVTGNLHLNNNKSNYLGSDSNKRNSDFTFDEIGAIYQIDSKNQNSALKKTTLSLSVNNDNSLNSDFYFKGLNPNSVAHYFLQYANHGYNGAAVPYQLVQLGPSEDVTSAYDLLNSNAYGFSAQQALLGYQSYILEQGGNGQYVANVANGPYLQQSSVITDGMNAKVTGNIAFDFNERFYIGANLNYHSIDYKKSNQIYEVSTQPSFTNGVSEILFTNTNYTYGDGFSFNIGALAKITDQFRVGASYESPTWFTLNDEFQQELETIYYINGAKDYTNVSPNLITVYDSYKLKTPSKLTASMAYVLGTKGLLSVDYSRKDYSTISYKDDMGSYSNLNSFYSNEMKAVNEIRVGTEYRINQMSLRAGYRFAESPYKNSNILGDLNSISGGLGYSFDNKRVDLAYTYTHQPIEMSYISSGLNDVAKINTKQHVISLSYNVYF